MFAPPSPVLSRRGTSAMNVSHRESVNFSAETNGGGLGNLADELADAWEQEDEGYDYASGQEMGAAGSQQMEQSDEEDGYMQPARALRAQSPPALDSPDRRNRLRATQLRQHRRQESHYDGSDYGNDSDLDEADISPSLEMQMADVESLARRGIENNGSESDHVIERTVEALRDLGSQSGIENSAMR